MKEYNFRTRKFYPLFKKKEGEDKALELRQIRLHDLRHSYASLMLQQGESVTYVKEQMGHHSIQVTVTSTGISFRAQTALQPIASKRTSCRLVKSPLPHTPSLFAGDRENPVCLRGPHKIPHTHQKQKRRDIARRL